MFGKAAGFTANLDLSTLDGTNGFKLSGVAAGDHSGRSVASAGDVNGDGFADLIVGARQADRTASIPARATWCSASCPTPRSTGPAPAATQTLAGGDFNDTLSGLGGDDRLYGHGGNDSLDGGAGDDTAVFSGALADYLIIDDGPAGASVTIDRLARQARPTAPIL